MLTLAANAVTDESSTETAAVAENVEIHNFIMPEVGEKIAVINVKDYGTIKIKLFPEDAEKGVENFVGLAEMGYYDELIFHRIIPSFDAVSEGITQDDIIRKILTEKKPKIK
mgnify:CR=1 FL=1